MNQPDRITIAPGVEFFCGPRGKFFVGECSALIAAGVARPLWFADAEPRTATSRRRRIRFEVGERTVRVRQVDRKSRKFEVLYEATPEEYREALADYFVEWRKARLYESAKRNDALQTMLRAIVGSMRGSGE